MLDQKRGDDLLALLRLERADRVDERAARLQPLRRPIEQLALELGAGGDDLRARSIEDFGMTAERAGRGAGRVEQDRIELPLRLPRRRIGLDEVSSKMRTL